MPKNENKTNETRTKALSKQQQLDEHREDPKDTRLTTDQGVKIRDNHNSLKAGSRGPTLMEDFIFREKMTHFDHERIPERIVHARGSAAHGYFQVYESQADLTRAAFLQDPSVKTPVFVRFSTVVGFRGSADTVRDVRGFATKFYTGEGNFDLVGNNMPVFFIQDAIKFPDLVHSIKPEPHNEMPQASAAHDTFWDFISLMPESMHMIMWVISDRAIPRSFSTMEGFGVHTFRMINAEGKARFVKFHWKPKAGVYSMVWDEAQKLAGKDPDWLRRDLYESIEMGNYPEFELGVQIVEEEDEHKFDFDLLDATKIIPEEQVPVRIIGKMVLDRNPDNFFAETEQAAFHPGHVVAGIDFTNDPLLQGRLFSYLDTQLIRLGGPNFAEIPINRPLVEVHNHHRDGFMRQTINKGRVSYEPNSLGGGCPMHSPEHMQAFVHHAEKLEGNKVRVRSESFLDHYSQAKLFWRSMTAPEQKHMIDAFHFELGKVETLAIRERMLAHLAIIDKDLAAGVSEKIGVDVPSSPVEYLQLAPEVAKRVNHEPTVGTSPALSMEPLKADSIAGRKVAALVAEGSDDADVMKLEKYLASQGAKLELVAPKLGKMKGSKGGELDVKKTFQTAASIMYDAVYVPGGSKAVKMLMEKGGARHFVAEAFKHCKPIFVSEEAFELLDQLELSDSKSNSGKLAELGVFVTAKGVDDSFTATVRDALIKARYWEREALAEMVAA